MFWPWIGFLADDSTSWPSLNHKQQNLCPSVCPVTGPWSWLAGFGANSQPWARERRIYQRFATAWGLPAPRGTGANARQKSSQTTPLRPTAPSSTEMLRLSFKKLGVIPGELNTGWHTSSGPTSLQCLQFWRCMMCKWMQLLYFIIILNYINLCLGWLFSIW